MLMAGTPSRHARRGFTLVELMTVVIIVVVLATLAVYAVRKYVWSAKTTEAYDMINSIRSAQEAYRAETFAYCDVANGCGASGGDLGTWWPAAAPDKGKAAWDDGVCSAAPCIGFRTLGVRPNGAVLFRYSSVAGGAGTVQAAGIRSTEYQLPPSSPGPWYVVRAVGDQNGDGVLSEFLSSSFSSGVYTEHETE
jgi:prepilin-type N-terminal cleavage/methylation domain-containing protein